MVVDFVNQNMDSMSFIWLFGLSLTELQTCDNENK